MRGIGEGVKNKTNKYLPYEWGESKSQTNPLKKGVL